MDKEDKWRLAKAEILEVQAAFLQIVLYHATTYEELRNEVQDHIKDTKEIVRLIREEVQSHAPDRN